MTRIRVDTNLLHEKAGDFNSIRGLVNKLGQEVTSVAAALPSYDGQLSGPARTAGLETKSRAAAMAIRQSEHAQRLVQLAKAFAKVDQESVATFETISGAVLERYSDAFEPSPLMLHVQATLDRQFLEEAGIAMVGNWTDEEISATAKTVRQIGGKFKEKLNSMGYIAPNEAMAFLAVFGPMTFYYGDKDPGASKLNGYWGISGDHKITFLPGKVTSRLVGHELGHELSHLLYDNLAGYVNIPDHPVSMLIHTGVWVDGKFVTGNRYGSYDRNGGLSAKDGNGYRSDDYHDGWQYHPRSMGADGNTADEDWADIFLNWSFNSFADNTHGKALFTWTDSHMDTWLKMAFAKKDLAPHMFANIGGEEWAYQDFPATSIK